MPTIKQYLLTEIARSTAIVISALVLLFSIFDLFRETRDIGQEGYHLSKAIFYVLLTAPEHFYQLFPIAALIGTVFSITQLVLHSEYTVMRTAGLSPWQMSSMLAQIGLLIAIPPVLTGEFVIPQSAELALHSRLTAIKGVVAQQFPSGFWFRDHQFFVNVYNILPDNTLSGIKIFEANNHQSLDRILFAQSAKLTDDHQWHLQNVSEMRITADQVSRSFLTELYWPTNLTREILNASQLAPASLSSENLYRTIQYLEQNQQQSLPYQSSLWSKLLYPLSVISLVLLALPFSYFQQRSGGVSGRIFVAIMLGLGFYLLNKLTAGIAQLQILPVFLSSLLPSTLLLTSILSAIFILEKR